MVKPSLLDVRQWGGEKLSWKHDSREVMFQVWEAARNSRHSFLGPNGGFAGSWHGATVPWFPLKEMKKFCQSSIFKKLLSKKRRTFVVFCRAYNDHFEEIDLQKRKVYMLLCRANGEHLKKGHHAVLERK